jgi:large subunit ribosomal protein L23
VNVVAFEVDRRANKIEIKRAVEAQFDRKVAEVRVVSMHGKERRQGRYVGHKPNWKKAYVRLAAGEKSIEFFEGV